MQIGAAELFAFIQIGVHDYWHNSPFRFATYGRDDLFQIIKVIRSLIQADLLVKSR
jgi:hypothetical protein